MSEFVITPNFTKKTARFHGAVAAGEHAAVRIIGAASLLSGTPSDSTLRLRVLIKNPKVRTLAVFPFVTAAMVEEDDSLVQDVWEVDGDDLTCTLNLNTAQALRLFRRLPEMEVLAVLDDPVQRMMHFSDYMLMRGWPQEPSETPIDLGNYRDFVAETKAALAAHSAAISENASAIAAEQTARENADAEMVAGVSSVSEVVSTKADAAALAGKQDAGDYATRQELGTGLAGKQDAGEYLTEHQSLEGLATTEGVNAALAEKANNSDLDALATKEELAAEESARQSADAAHDTTDAQHDAGIESNAEGVQHAEEHITEHALDTTRHITAEERAAWNSAISSLQSAIDVLAGSDSGLSIRAIASLVVSQVVADADTSFDTLKEIADWILNDTTGAAKMANDIAALKNGKVDKETGKGLSTNDYTDAEKNRITTLEGRGYLMRDENGVYAVFPN